MLCLGKAIKNRLTAANITKIMELYNDILCATHTELTDGIMTNDVLMYYCKKDAALRVRRGCNGKPALYAVDRLPAKNRAEVKRRCTAPDIQAQAMAFVDTIVIDQIAATYYEGVIIDGARGLSHEKRMQYTNSASILNAIQAHLSAAAAEQKKVGRWRRVKMSEYWQRMAEYLPRIADVYPHDLPESPRVLQRKYQKYVQGGHPNYDVLVSGKFRNRNAAKVATEWKTQARMTP